MMDPQHRHFLEVAWLALEHAGHVPESTPGAIGIFGGMYNATYFQRHLMPRPDLIARLGELQVMLGNEKDYVTSRAAHRLGRRPGWLARGQWRRGREWRRAATSWTCLGFGGCLIGGLDLSPIFVLIGLQALMMVLPTRSIWSAMLCANSVVPVF